MFSKGDKEEKKSHIPTKVLKYLCKYATRGISKKTRQTIIKRWPIPTHKRLKGLNLDRLFKKGNFKNLKYNGKLEKTKVNTQLRILDALGPLSVLWTEAERIKKCNKGMDPSDVISLVQCAIVLLGNAHFVYNIERRKSVLVKALPEAVDLLSNKNVLDYYQNAKPIYSVLVF